MFLHPFLSAAIKQKGYFNFLPFCTLPYAFQGDSVENKSEGQKKEGGGLKSSQSLFILEIKLKTKGYCY